MDNQQIIDIIKKSTPAVVSLVVSKDLPKVEGFYNMPYGGKNLMVPKVKKDEKESVQVGGGSGFLVSDDGVILTNSHVVHDPKADFTAFLGNDKEEKHEVEVLARDPIHDIAICKMEGKDLAHLELGDSSETELGEFVLAVGNALGEFSDTVSFGMVSGLSRYITARRGRGGQPERLRGLIQTDAAVNPGNSGGPLINMDGKVIGINTAVVHGAQNISFSIPIDHAKQDLEEVKKYGHIRIPFIGVRYVMINEAMQKQNDLPVDHGALIMRQSFGEPAVVPDSSADHAGLKEFDIILEADGEKITPDHTLQDIVQEYEIGDKIKLKVMREEKEKEIELELEEKKK